VKAAPFCRSRVHSADPFNEQKGSDIMRTNTKRSVATALAGALALTTMNLAPAQAAAAKGTQAKAATTTFSARRHWHHGNDAALGAVAGMFGVIAGLAAADAYRNDYYGYYGAPYYGYPSPYYGSYGYAPRYHYRGGGGHWHGGHGGGHHHHH
jgi:hypothetical protein